MVIELLDFICCPICRENFDINEIKKEASNIQEAILVCKKCEQMYPIISGVPRLLPNAVTEFYSFFQQHKDEIPKQQWSTNFVEINKKLLSKLLRKQRRTQNSFSLEWSFQGKDQMTWGLNPKERSERIIFKALQMKENEFENKIFLDAGCGNGLLTTELGKYFKTVIGIDLSFSVEKANEFNTKENVHFVQGDLMNPPLKSQSVDILFSSGVLHHTPNTELTFSCLTPLLKQNGRFYMWLYKPKGDLHHQIMIRLRKIFYKLPLKLNAYFFLVTFVPFALVKRKIKNILTDKKEVELTWRTQLINFIDGLTPRYRFEHTPEEVKIWYRKRNFKNLTVSIDEYLGFGIFGDLD